MEIIKKDFDPDSEFYWELNNDAHLLLFQRLTKDEFSTIRWAIFNMTKEDISVKESVSFINK